MAAQYLADLMLNVAAADRRISVLLPFLYFSAFLHKNLSCDHRFARMF
jgi:hypothetical protein